MSPPRAVSDLIIYMHQFLRPYMGKSIYFKPVQKAETEYRKEQFSAK